MDLQREIILTDKHGGSVTIPFINLLRVTIVKLQDFFMEYQQENKRNDILGFNDWIKDKLGTRGKNVLL